MALSKPKVGSSYKTTSNLGEGFGSVPSGSSVEVLEVVPAGTEGVGDTGGEDAVLVQYEDEGHTRVVSLSLSAFHGLVTSEG